jgi:hypothetical protein
MRHIFFKWEGRDLSTDAIKLFCHGNNIEDHSIAIKEQSWYYSTVEAILRVIWPHSSLPSLCK